MMMTDCNVLKSLVKNIKLKGIFDYLCYTLLGIG